MIFFYFMLCCKVLDLAAGNLFKPRTAKLTITRDL